MDKDIKYLLDRIKNVTTQFLTSGEKLERINKLIKEFEEKEGLKWIFFM